MIPKKIFQTWKTKTDLSTKLKNLTDLWKVHNPEYEYKLFDNKDCETFISEYFDADVLTAYRRLIPGALKADLWRYCVLYVYGGVYADMDTMCMNSLDTFLKDYDFVAPIDFNYTKSEGEHNIFNAFIACVPNHPVMQGCINRIVRQVLKNIRPSSPLDLTGPGVLGRELNIYLERQENASFIGMEGIQQNNTFLLHCQSKLEYVGIKNADILFQNKNGNPDITAFYNDLCHKEGIKGWLTNPPW